MVDINTSRGKGSYSPLHNVELREAIAQRNNAKALEEIKKHTDGYCSLSGKSSYLWGDKIKPINIDKHIEKAEVARKEAREWWQSLTPDEQKAYIKDKKNFK
ncbi:hypothetical protein [Pseudescherichia sp.]|uniref:hypothetical protein n=1 Tax=Pseudescherichia sp. TaxID=2055881 RepID=UPI0028AE2671|nr:hypothetical protein [Pseudescherichia sp.]